MRTVSIGVENLCVPCCAHCRYCLLSWDGKPLGVDYDRGKHFTEKFAAELTDRRSDLRTFYYIGYCMDTPRLVDYIKFCQSIGSPAGEFLQLNGLDLRDERETERFVREIAAAGVKRVDLTFYGLRECHDRFAGRTGDFDFLLRLLWAAERAGLEADISLPILRENMDQVDGLLDLLAGFSVGQYFAFLPHGKGRGRLLENQRLTRAEFDSLSQRVRACFSPRVKYRTEGEWIREGNWLSPETRTLTLSLTPDKIGQLEEMPAEEIVAMLEELDDRFYAQMPPVAELARLYGDPDSDRMYRLRDLELAWRQRFLRERGTGLHDMDDERGHFSIRA